MGAGSYISTSLDFDPPDVADVSADGGVALGNQDGGGTYFGTIWDESGNGSTIDTTTWLEAVSAGGQRIGGHKRGFDDNFVPHIWTPDSTDQWVEQELMWQNETSGVLETIFGLVRGVSDSGYAIGEFVDTERSDFIWHESFNGIDSEFVGLQAFDVWLMAVAGIELAPNFSLAGIIESDRIIHIAVSGDDSSYIVSINTIPEPGSSVVLFLVAASFVLRRAKKMDRCVIVA